MVASLALASVLALALYVLFFRLRRDARLPPGPKYLGKGPFEMPPEPYKRFIELSKNYGAQYAF
jgi:hypothetical protein